MNDNYTQVIIITHTNIIIVHMSNNYYSIKYTFQKKILMYKYQRCDETAQKKIIVT